MKDYLKEVENEEEFFRQRELWLSSMTKDVSLKESALNILEILERKKYTYQWDWLGIPIIKMPEEILLIQEAIHTFRPTAIVEVGVARGGGIALYHSIQTLCGIDPNILGIDIKFFDHTKKALSPFLNQGVKLLEEPSTSDNAKSVIRTFVEKHESVLVVLDGDHTHENVLNELNMLDELLPQGSIVLVADTLLQEINQTGKTRDWDKRRNPATALTEFMGKKPNWRKIQELCARVIISESPQGWIQKVI